MKSNVRNLLAISVSLCAAASVANAETQALEEIVVTARKAAESLQDVPVTVTAISDETIDQLGLDDASELTNLIPNLTIQKGGTGGGGMIRLRGIGSSAISSAFDTAVAFNIDGIQVNSSKYMFHNMFDLGQIEVLKGPQSLYFGKSASAGVVTLRSNDPGSEFEASLGGSYEFEEAGSKYEAVISGPLTDTLGARLALKWSEVDEIARNNATPANWGSIAAGGPPYLGADTQGPRNDYRGEESRDMRATVVWAPSDRLLVNFKGLYSEYETDGYSYMLDVACVGDTAQDTALPLIEGYTVPSGLDCDPTDGVVQLGDIPEIEGAGTPRGRVPFYDSEVASLGLTIDYNLTDDLTLTSVTGWIENDVEALDGASYDVNASPGSLQEDTRRENYSQEFRLSRNSGGFFDYTLGAFYQTREIDFVANHTTTSPAIVFGPDSTGYTAGYLKVHETEADAYSLFFSTTFRPTDTVEITAGARYSDEEHENTITVPRVHESLSGFGLFLPSGSRITGLEFEDDSIDPEVSVKWQVADEVNLFAVYKSGFKSGGIDNSALPTPDLPVTAGDLLVFDSETVDGFEVGMKSDLLDQTLRFNATVYLYTYEDLQTQEFDLDAFNFVTLNAGEVESRGAELETVWLTPYEGLVFDLRLAYSDSEYTDDFFVTGETNLDPETGLENMKGRQIQGNSYWSGNASLNYERSLTSLPIDLNLGLFASYRSKFQAGIFSNSPDQGDFWKFDATVGVSSTDGQWELALIAQNLEDERTLNSSIAGRVSTVPEADTGFRDQLISFSHGRQVTLQAKWNF